jgi:hypothetical protein
MDQLGHTDPGFTLRVYRHGMRRDTGDRDRLRALVGQGEDIQHKSQLPLGVSSGEIAQAHR